MQAQLFLALGSGEIDEVDETKMVVGQVPVDQF